MLTKYYINEDRLEYVIGTVKGTDSAGTDLVRLTGTADLDKGGAKYVQEAAKEKGSVSLVE